MITKYNNCLDIVSDSTLQILERPRVLDLAFFNVQQSDRFDDEIKIMYVSQDVIEILSPCPPEQELIANFRHILIN